MDLSTTRISNRAVALVFLSVGMLIAALPAQAQTETVLYRFSGVADGIYPWSNLILDSHGNLYGTTGNGGPSGAGTVFELSSRKKKIFHSFSGQPDGALPESGVVRDKEGNLYGTTCCGGVTNHGTVYKVSPEGVETVLHNFAGPPDGWGPVGGLVRDREGNLYGTTSMGGTGNCGNGYGCGTIFELTASGKERVLYSFTGQSDGYTPLAGLHRDERGNLYGTTVIGGIYSVGTVYKLTRSGSLTVLHSFAGPDGANPTAVLVRDKAGNLYGTTGDGGAQNMGTVFEITTAGAEKVLYSFTGGSSDGSYPRAGVARDANGNLYGTTYSGGSANKGTVFKVTPAGAETILHSFTDSPDGANPVNKVTLDAKGNIYGMTFYGGNTACSSGCGIVFKVTP
ncbi:MAG TPA: choice-of-anchor tandem repeat GloVer-containing protein [Terriglobales bacterium]|jgi:uncharacterized repeat protein (TIGR03803 family)|nr:choice-of-anchor tandem repeat GloVer-containing protein [Terriglobales bacterium]